MEGEQHQQARQQPRGQPVEILPRLWVGSLASLRFLSGNTKRSWTVISVLGSDKLISLCNFMIQDANTNQRCRRHIVWKLQDKNDSIFFSDELTAILNAMDDAILPAGETTEHDVLVHCAMGVSRSVTLCAAWIMTRQRRSLQDTMEIIRKARPEALPNMGFIAALRALESSDFDVQRACQRLGQDKEIG